MTSPRVQAYVALLRTAERLHAEVSRHLIEDGFTASQFSALKALKLQGPLSHTEIAESLLKSGGNITLVVSNLERMGWVTKTKSPKDGRKIMVDLTADGAALFDAIYPRHLKKIESAMAGWTPEECGQAMELLAKLSPGEDPSCTIPISEEME